MYNDTRLLQFGLGIPRAEQRFSHIQVKKMNGPPHRLCQQFGEADGNFALAATGFSQKDKVVMRPVGARIEISFFGHAEKQ